MGEVHCKRSVQYANGKIYGLDENGELTKTLLCVMVKSICGKYRDVICMSPISKLSAEKIHTIWTNCLKLVTNVRFDTVVTITDGLEANMKFITQLTGSNSHPEYVFNPFSPEKRVYLMNDTVHLLKNIYGNLLSYGT